MHAGQGFFSMCALGESGKLQGKSGWAVTSGLVNAPLGAGISYGKGEGWYIQNDD